jgi:GGDEF-like domain
VQWLGDRDVLVATKDGCIVVVAPAEIAQSAEARSAPATKTLGDLMHTELSRSGRGRPWRITIGRPYPGAYGIARSYEEAARDSRWRSGCAWTPRSSPPRTC